MPVPASTSAIVLLHYFGGSRREWASIEEAWASDRTVLAVDLPGFGDRASQGAADVAGMADAVDEAIVAAGLTSCIVVGHSMAGKVAMLLAARVPGYLRGLILVASSPASPEPMTDDARDALLAFDRTPEAAADYVDDVTAKRLPDQPRAIAMADAIRASPDAWRAWAERGSREDLAAAIGSLRLPALLVAGGQDEALGEDVQRERVLPQCMDAELVVIAGGHLLPLENPVGLRLAMERFVARLS